MPQSSIGLATLALASFITTADGFYLPGIAPHEYEDGDPVSVCAHCKLDFLLTFHPADYLKGQQAHVDEDLATV